MKNIVKTTLLAAGLFAAVHAGAQTVKQDVKRDAKKVGNKTSELAAKGKAAVVDKKYEGHYGPMGETVYINKHSKYYYVTKKGHRVYASKAELKTTKPM